MPHRRPLQAARVRQQHRPDQPRELGKRPCDEPGFLAAQVFAVATETGWPEERILFMTLADLLNTSTVC